MSTETYYNQKADEFYHRTVSVDMAHLYKEFLPYIPVGGTILDAGCGSGRDAKFFQENGYKIVAMDSSIEMVKLSSQLIGKPTLHLSFEHLDMKDAFDGIWANASLLHLPASMLPQIFGRLCNALKPGGILLMSYKYGDGEGIRSERFFNNQTENSIKKLIAQVPEFEEIKSWQSVDTRVTPDFWLNSLVRRKEPNVAEN